MRIGNTAAALGVLLACVAPAGAGDIKGGSTLLDNSGHAQLERWLGQGEFNLHKVYTRKAGDTALDFHRAADMRGPTFTLIDVTNSAGDSFLVGGFNPQHWSSTEGWHTTERDFWRNAFIFNMTEPAVYHQVPSSYVLPSQGALQTFNGSDYGPTFGTGHDLYVNRSLQTAFSWQLTYGNPVDGGASIVDRSVGGQIVKINALEVFAISPIPEPAEWMMLGGGLALLGAVARRRRRRL